MKELDITRAKILGVLIRDARLYAGRSRKDCAAALNITEDAFMAAEEGEASLALPQLEALAMYLDVPLSHFWGTETLDRPRRVDYTDFIDLRNKMVGAHIRQARLEANRRPADLAEELDTDEATIAAYEAGKEAVPYFQLERLGKYLGVTVDYFLDRQHGPLAEHEARHKVADRMAAMPEDVQAFIANPVNLTYLETAKKLSEIDVQRLRTIAESILDITF